MRPIQKYHRPILALLISLIFNGCSFTDKMFGDASSPITHLPVKVSKNGRWGFVDLRGELVCQDEFKTMPSVAVNGITRVSTDKKKVEYYRIGKKVEQLGDTYLRGTLFSEGLAVVVKENGFIGAIDEAGEEVFLLDGRGEDEILVAGNFHEDLAPVMNARNEWGFIDKDGRLAVKCQFSRVEGFHDGYARVGKDGKILFIDKSGSTVLEPKSAKSIGRQQEDAFVYSEEDREFGLMDIRGEKVIKANSKYAMMAPPKGNLLIYASDANSDYGVMNLKEEVVLRPKYDYILLTDKLILATIRGKNTTAFDHDGNELWKLDVDGILPLQADCGVSFDGDDMEMVSLEDGKTLGKETFTQVGIGLKEFVESIWMGADMFTWTEFVSSDYSDVNGALKGVLTQLRPRDFFSAGFNGGYVQASKAIEAMSAMDRDIESASLNGEDHRYFWELDENEGRTALSSEDEEVRIADSILAAETALMALEQQLMVDSSATEAMMEAGESSAALNQATAALKTPQIKDAAPEIDGYQTTLRSGTIQLDRKLSFSAAFEFSDRIKKEVYKDFFNGYYTVPNTLVGYDINPGAKIQRIWIEFNTRDEDATEAMKKMVEAHLDRIGFKSTGSGTYMSQGVTASFVNSVLVLEFPVPVQEIGAFSNP